MMNNFKRRDFIKKTILTSLISGGTLKLFSTVNQNKNYSSLIENDSDYWKIIRNQFLLTKDRIYLNTASLGPSPNQVINAINEWNIKLETDCETGHEYSIKTNEKAAELLNVSTQEIAITRNTTEGVNIMVQSIPFIAGDEVVITKDEHVGGAMPWIALMKEKGVTIKLIDLDYSGENNYKIITEAITEKTKAVFFSHVTCSTGMVLPAEKIVTFCRSKNIYTCVDGAQAVGMINVDLKKINPDFYATSGHKWLFGPKGTGILFINKNVISKINPVYVGAYSDLKFDLNNLEVEYLQTAQRIEYGTRNVSITIAFAEALNFINKISITKIEQRGKELSSLLKNELGKISSVEILSPNKLEFSSAMVTFRLKNKDYKYVQEILQKEFKFRLRGIYENNLNAIRVSCSVFNNEEEIISLVKAITVIANK